MSKKLILVRADTNDADYDEQLTEVTEGQLQLLLPLFAAIAAFTSYKTEVNGLTWTHSHNFPYGECCREDLGEKDTVQLYGEHVEALKLFSENFLPYSEYGIHTIETIRVLTVTDDTILL